MKTSFDTIYEKTGMKIVGPEMKRGNGPISLDEWREELKRVGILPTNTKRIALFAPLVRCLIHDWERDKYGKLRDESEKDFSYPGRERLIGGDACVP